MFCGRLEHGEPVLAFRVIVNGRVRYLKRKGAIEKGEQKEKNESTIKTSMLASKDAALDASKSNANNVENSKVEIRRNAAPSVFSPCQLFLLVGPRWPKVEFSPLQCVFKVFI